MPLRKPVRGSSDSQDGSVVEDQTNMPVPPNAVRFCAYGAPAVPGASEAATIAGAGFTVRPQSIAALCPCESVSCKSKTVAPATAFPDNDPAESSTSQDGRPTADQLYGGYPPLAMIVAPKVRPAVVASNGHTVVIRGDPPGGSISRLSEAGGDAIPRLSVTTTEIVTVAAAGGVPEMIPDDAFNLAHEGRFCADHARVPVPPLATSCAEYGTNGAPAGNAAARILGIGFTVMVMDFEAVTPSESVAVTMKS